MRPTSVRHGLLAAASMSVLSALGAVTVMAPAPAAAQGEPADEEGPGWIDGSRFLMQASFGPTGGDINRVRRLGYAGWIDEQSRRPLRPWTARVRGLADPDIRVVSDLFWESAIEGDDLLRARVTYALANIITVSMNEGGFFFHPETFTHYYDALNANALGNYTDLIREVSLSPAMGTYLSHLANEKADAESGTAPDENYAREVMQLFTIGLDELNMDGTLRGGETYDTDDVTGLAAVFTGLSWDGDRFRWPTNLDERVRSIPMAGFEDYHEPDEKAVLGGIVPAGTDAEASVTAGLDILLAHPNLAPFVSKQMIQHLVTSNPSPAYVGRVARAFEAGSYASDGITFGEGRRGDMLAMVAAILLDDEARSRKVAMGEDFGRVRDPVLRFAHLTRAFRDDGGAPFSGQPPASGAMRYSERPDVLGQKALAPPSVFGWYRPGYVLPGGWAAQDGLVSPEMQLATASNIVGYIDWMWHVTQNNVWNTDFFDMDYRLLEEYAAEPDRLVMAMDNRLTGGTMSQPTKQRIAEAVAVVPVDSVGNWSEVNHRVSLALFMTVTSPDYIVQR